MKNVRRRQMNAADIPAVLEIEKECFLSGWSFESYKNELSRDDSQTFIVESEKVVAGYAILRLITSASESEILNIAVKPEFQRHGIGTILLSEIVGFAKSRQIRSIWLEVRKTNFTAQDFYRRNGFVLSGQRKNFYTNPTEDALIMKLDL
jgi:[ribosomal protein S18]-alanine N-acetyltransferase